MYRRPVVLLTLIGICLAAGTAGAAPLAVKINFQLDTAAVPEGYLKDCGEIYGDRGNGYSYGWSANATADDRERSAHADKRYDTLVHASITSAKTWEIALPAGKYDLFFVCGDPSNVNQTNSFDVEGLIVTDPDGQDNFDEYTLSGVVVTDGRLTIKPVAEGLNGKFCFIDIAQILPPVQAKDPVPADGTTDLPRDAALAWTAAPAAQKHNVYLGTSFEDVNAATAADARGALMSETQAETTYQPADSLSYGQTYYWRVDEINSVDATIHKGEVWSFTVEPYAYPIQNITATASSTQVGMGGPQTTVNGAGLNANDQHSLDGMQMWLSASAPSWIQYEFDQAYKLHEMWVWNSNQLIEAIIGFGAKSVTIEHSLDGVTWTELAGVPEFAQATSTATYTHNTTVDFGGVSAKYVRLTINSSWGGLPTSGLAEVRFFQIPVQAYQPTPADGAANVDIDTVLDWRMGRDVASHTLYLGKDKDAVVAGTVAPSTVTGQSFAPVALDLATTYFWRIDEVNDDSVYTGPVWSFTTREYAIVDDFESYNDDDNRIYEAWIDGYTDGKSGSVVGNMEAPFAEQTIIHGDVQSMPVAYDNTSMAFSEATRTFDAAQDWTAHGITSLCVYFRGAPGNSSQLYLKINNTKVAYTGDPAYISSQAWHPWVVDLSGVSGTKNVTKLTIGMEGAGAKGTLYVDDIRLYRVAPEPLPEIEILWVSFHDADDSPSAGAVGNGFTEAVDKAYTDLLKAQGYDVVRFVQTATPDLDIVNSARLVIISRSVASGSFQDAAATKWNSVVVPMINLNGYTVRNNRLGFYSGDTILDTTGDIKLTVKDASHPIFAGISLTNGTMKNPYAGIATYADGIKARGISIVTEAPDDTGTILATVAPESSAAGSAGATVIAEWPAGALVTHTGGVGTDVLGGPRLVFLTGAREADGKSSETAGLDDLSADGEKMFLNAVEYMLQQ